MMESTQICAPHASDEAPEETRKRTCEENNENASKRARVHDDNKSGGPVYYYLPPEVWAKALEFLEYNDVMQSTAVSKFVPHEVLPKVETLFIHNKKQLNPAHAKRFETGCVRTIFISCFASTNRAERNQEEQVPDERSLFTVPFLQRFAKLEYVWFGGINAGYDDVGYDVIPKRFSPTGVCYRRSLFYSSAPSHVHRAVVQSLASAFSFGLLPKDLQVDGIFNEREKCCSQPRGSSACIVCDSICKSGPLHAAFHGNVCISFERRIRHLSRREGGVEFLKKPDSILTVLSHYCNLSFHVEFDVQEPGFMADLRFLIEIGCNPRNLSPEQIAKVTVGYQRTPNMIVLVHELQRLGFAIEEDMLEELDTSDEDVEDGDGEEEEEDEEAWRFRVRPAYLRAEDDDWFDGEGSEVDEDDVDQADDW